MLSTISLQAGYHCPPAVEVRLNGDGGTDLFHATARNQLLVQNWHAKIYLVAQVCNELFAFTYMPFKESYQENLVFGMVFVIGQHVDNRQKK